MAPRARVVALELLALSALGCSGKLTCRAFAAVKVAAPLIGQEDVDRASHLAVNDNQAGGLMDLFEIFSRYFWAIAIAITAINHVILLNRISASNEAPEVVNAARAYLPKVTFASLPCWLIMAVGTLTGGMPTVWHVFRPQDGNAYVLAFLAYAGLLALANAWYSTFGEGAFAAWSFMRIANSNRLFAWVRPVWLFKLLGLLSPLFFALWVYLVVGMNARIPLH